MLLLPMVTVFYSCYIILLDSIERPALQTMNYNNSFNSKSVAFFLCVKRVRNHSNENVLPLQVHFHVNKTHFI